MASGWKENKWHYEATNRKREKMPFFLSFPIRAAHLNSVPNPKAMKEASKVWVKPVRASVLLPLAGIAVVWAANYLLLDSFSRTLIPITNNYVIDSLVLSMPIAITGFLLRRRARSYDDMAREIEMNAREGDPQ